MNYKPERALTPVIPPVDLVLAHYIVEMNYKPERALTHVQIHSIRFLVSDGRNEL